MGKFLWLLAFVMAMGIYPANAGKFMSGDELKKLFSGVSIAHKSPRSGKPLVMRFNPGGSAAVKVEDGRAGKGKWWVSGNQFCMKFSKFVKGKTICHKLERRGGSLIRYNSRGKPKPGIDWRIVG